MNRRTHGLEPLSGRRSWDFSPMGASIACRLASIVAVLAFVALAGCSSGTATGGAAPASSTIESSPSVERTKLHGTERSTESGSQNQNDDVRAHEPVASATGGTAASGTNARGAARVAEEIERRRGMAQAFTVHDAATVEELLEQGLALANVSPVHLAVRGTPGAAAVRCAWRGIARTAAQREGAIRYWLRLGADDAIPSVAYVEALFAVTLDALNPEYRETAKSNFLAIARGGLSEEYLFLTCFADYTVSNYLLGAGATSVTVAYDKQGEAWSYELYRREHEAGTFGTEALQARGDYEASLQAKVVAAEEALAAEIGGKERIVFLAPMGAHHAIAFEAWQAVAHWDVVTESDGTVNAVRVGAPRATRSTRRRWPT